MARNPHRQGGLATPPPQLDDDDEPAPAPAPVDDEDQEDDAGNDPADDEPRPAARTAGRGVDVANDGAGWVLGLLLWGWVVLPFVKGGPAQVKAVWMAKFLNKAPDGSWLP